MPDEYRPMLDPVTWSDLEALRLDHAKPVADTVSTPFPTWNTACRGEGGGMGLAPGWLVVGAGKPGAGKTLLALNAAYSAMRQGCSVLYYSLEMSKPQLVTRFVAVGSGCDVRRIERGMHFSATTFEEAMRALDAAKLLGRLFLCDRPPRTTTGLAEALREGADSGCRLAVVDYVGLVGRQEYPAIFERTQAVSGLLQQLAFETNLTILALSQLNRGALAQRSEEPGIEALKGGSLDEDADQVLLLDYSQFVRTPTGATTNVLLAKNRHGPLAKIPVSWDYHTLRAHEAAQREGA